MMEVVNGSFATYYKVFFYYYSIWPIWPKSEKLIKFKCLIKFLMGLIDLIKNLIEA